MSRLWMLTVFSLLQSSTGLPLSDFYPYGFEAGDAELGPNDDGSSPAISLPSPFPFFDTLQETVFVNNNGDVSFSTAVSTFTPQAFPLAGNLQLIAPYWADVDTRGTGRVWYRSTTDTALRNQARELIRSSFINQMTFDPDYLFIATWDSVGYYSQHTDKVNTFQCIMATDGVNSFVIFFYADDGIQWTTGDASGGSNGFGGTPAQVGFNAGDGIRYSSVPGSRTADIVNIETTSNVDMAGVWVFRVDAEDIATGGCTSDPSVTLTIAPRIGNMLGGTAVRVSGPCLEETDLINCTFGGIVTPGLYVSRMEALCVSPQLAAPDAVAFQLTVVREGQVEFQGEERFYALSTDRGHSVDYVPSESFGLRLSSGHQFNIRWNKDSLLSIVNSSDITVDISLYELQSDIGEWSHFLDVASNMENNGEMTGSIPFAFCSSGIQTICPVIVLVQVSLTFTQMESQVLTRIKESDMRIGAWSGVRYFTQLSTNSAFGRLCDNWVNKQDGAGNQLRDRLRPCPLTLNQARTPNSGFEEQKISSLLGDTSYVTQWMDYFHPGTQVCFVQSSTISSDEGSRQQCCYDESGRLFVETGGGTADLFAPIDASSALSHTLEDIIPYIFCCKSPTPNCMNYTTHRPISIGEGFAPPPPACVYGDPHIVTLDGLKYTFNGKGEYVLIETDGDIFTLQGRMVQAEGADGGDVAATVFSALVATQSDSDTVQFELSRRGIDTLVNGERVDFSDLNEQPFNNVTVMYRGNNSYSATFSTGAYIEVRSENDIISTVLVSLPVSFQETTRGLMGSYNGDTSDDLAPRTDSGVGQPISVNATLQEIHEMFGVTWIITNEEESLFTYAAGENFQTFFFPDFIPFFGIQFTNQELEDQAVEICGDDQFCLYDIASTQRTDIGLTTLLGSLEFEAILNLSAPISCEPPCENGACVAENTCTCTDGYAGSTCSQLVVDECSVNPCENGGSCTLIGGNYLCDCVMGFSGSFCQNGSPMEIFDCECTHNIECSFSGWFTDEVSSEVIPNGKDLQCLIAFNPDITQPENFYVDEGFETNQQFLSPGSVSFLTNLGIITRIGFSSCEVSSELISSLPYGYPATTLQDLGFEVLHVNYMDEDGTFGSIQLSNSEVQEIVATGDYVIGGSLDEDNACSFQHLLYWLATLNEPPSSGSAEQGLEAGSIFASGSALLEKDILPISINTTVCKDSNPDGSTIVAVPVRC